MTSGHFQTHRSDGALRTPLGHLNAETALILRSYAHKWLEFRNWRRGILLPPFLLSACDAYTSTIILCVLAGLQANSIFGYSFYSFPYSLEFRGKRYQWYQVGKSIRRAGLQPVMIANLRE
jgi:hypothetical protein